MIDFIKKRFKEPSTFIGIFAAALGVAQSFNVPITADQIVSITTFLGAVLIVAPDKQHAGDPSN